MSSERPVDLNTLVEATKASSERSGLFVEHSIPHCSYCGFALLGLPSEGVCPECGDRYDPQTSRQLAQAPSVWRALRYLGLPVLIAVCVLIANELVLNHWASHFKVREVSLWITFILVSASIGWLCRRLLLGIQAFVREVLPTQSAQRRSVRAASAAFTFVCSFALGCGIMATIGGVVFSGICVGPDLLSS